MLGLLIPVTQVGSQSFCEPSGLGVRTRLLPGSAATQPLGAKLTFNFNVE